MLKRRSKHFALLLVLTMLATMFVGVGTASAASSYSVLSTPTVLNNGTAQTLSTIQIDIPQLEAKKQTLLITLPKDFEISTDLVTADTAPEVAFVRANNNAVAALNAALAPATATTKAGIVWQSDREFKVEFDPATSAFVDDYDVRLTVKLNKVIVPDSLDGDITATLTSLNGNFSSHSIVVGKALGSGEVDAYVNSTVTFSNNGTGNLDVEMNFKELTKTAIKSGNASIKVKLPKGLTWSNVGAAAPVVENVTTGAAAAAAIPDFSVNVSGSDARVLEINRTATAVVKSIIRVKGSILVDEDEAVIGDVVANISGTSTVKPTTLTLGAYVDYDVTAEVKGDVPTVKPGRLAEEVADFEIVEGAKGSLLNGRSVTMELPAGAKWAFDAAYTPDKTGSPAPGALQAVGTSGRKVKFNVTNTGGTKGKIKFENVEVDLSPDFSGDLKVTLEGAGLDKTELVIAKAASIATATATKPNVIIGLQNQDGGTIKITEAVKEAFKNNKDITLVLPSGVEWSKTPTVKVVNGDLSLDEKNITRNRGTLTIPVKSQSNTASTIEITDIKYTIDRTVPEGAITVELSGDAIAEVNDSVVTTAATRFYYTIPATGIIFPGDVAVIEFDSALTVTPASNIVKNEAAFVIGSTTYKLNGIDQTLDVAPYIKDSRTYMPIRYVGYALGIDDANIIWDGAKQSVTLMKGDKVVQLTIGSKVISINGAPVTMDVAPEISNSRTMLPISFVANAFGATASWDAATQTVTIK